MKTYKPNSKYKKWVEETVERLRIYLNLNNYRINLHFVERVEPYDHIPTADKGGYTAEMEADSVYMEIDIWLSRVAEQKFKDGKLRYLAEDLCHELIHEVLAPYYNVASKKKKGRLGLLNVDENITQKVTIIAMKGFKLLKK